MMPPSRVWPKPPTGRGQRRHGGLAARCEPWQHPGAHRTIALIIGRDDFMNWSDLTVAEFDAVLDVLQSHFDRVAES